MELDLETGEEILEPYALIIDSFDRKVKLNIFTFIERMDRFYEDYEKGQLPEIVNYLECSYEILHYGEVQKIRNMSLVRDYFPNTYEHFRKLFIN